MILFIFNDGAGLAAVTHSLSVLGLCCSSRGHLTLISQLVIVTQLRRLCRFWLDDSCSDVRRAAGWLKWHQQIKEFFGFYSQRTKIFFHPYETGWELMRCSERCPHWFRLFIVSPIDSWSMLVRLAAAASCLSSSKMDEVREYLEKHLFSFKEKEALLLLQHDIYQ